VRYIVEASTAAVFVPTFWSSGTLEGVLSGLWKAETPQLYSLFILTVN
jgi:hypothetical protein